MFVIRRETRFMSYESGGAARRLRSDHAESQRPQVPRCRAPEPREPCRASCPWAELAPARPWGGVEPWTAAARGRARRAQIPPLSRSELGTRDETHRERGPKTPKGGKRRRRSGERGAAGVMARRGRGGGAARRSSYSGARRRRRRWRGRRRRRAAAAAAASSVARCGLRTAVAIVRGHCVVGDAKGRDRRRQAVVARRC